MLTFGHCGNASVIQNPLTIFEIAPVKGQFLTFSALCLNVLGRSYRNSELHRKICASKYLKICDNSDLKILQTC